MKKELSDGWLFYLQEKADTSPLARELWTRDFDDREWQEVSVPYDWAVGHPFDRRHSSGTAYLCGGTGWYRYHFASDESEKDRHFRLHFDGVYKHCKVWCNGYYVGSHQNGYTPFSLDITEAVKHGGEDNVIAVEVSHEDIADSRWYTGSGIERPVYLETTGNAHFADGGVFFHIVDTENTEGMAKAFQIDVCAILEQSLAAPCKTEHSSCTVNAALSDEEGKTVWQSSCGMTLASGESSGCTLSGTLSDAKLWSCDNPSLYTLDVTLFGTGAEEDAFRTQVAFRTIRFDADKGFFCNGIPYKLKGVCVHEDAGCLGSAVPEEVWERRLRKLKDCGCNAIRMSHNPHAECLYALCDRLGFFVMDELYDEWANPKNKWTRGHNVYPPSHQGITEDFWNCWQQDMRSFVCAHRNHASIILWSIGNEIDYPNDPYCSPKFKEMTGNNDADKPAAERMYNPNHPDISQLPRIAAMLSRELKKYDTSRPVTMALAFPELSADTGVYDALDVVGFNYKEQFYEENHAAYPQKPFIGSENSHSLAAWKAVKDNDYISGQFLWTGIDYLGEAKGWPVHGAPAGLLDMAGFEKSGYYLRKSLWSEEAFVYLEASPAGKKCWSRSWNYAEGTVLDVRAFSSEGELSLHINGTAQDEQRYTAQKNEEGFFLFPNVTYHSGSLVAKSKAARDELCSTGAAAALSCTLRKGRRMHHVEIAVVDGEGKLVSNDESLITVAVAGDAVLAGLENGDLEDVTAYSSQSRHARNGRLLAYVRATASHGTAHVTLSADGKSGTMLEIRY